VGTIWTGPPGPGGCIYKDILIIKSIYALIFKYIYGYKYIQLVYIYIFIHVYINIASSSALPGGDDMDGSTGAGGAVPSTVEEDRRHLVEVHICVVVK
jgi:hypothetical protein